MSKKFKITGKPLFRSLYHLEASRARSGQSGLTLVELIVALVVLGALATILVAFMGTALTRSAEPIFLAQEGAKMEGVMESITSDFRYYARYEGEPLDRLEDEYCGEENEHYSIECPDDSEFENGDADYLQVYIIGKETDQSLTAIFSE